MQRLILPATATGLVLLAVGGVYFGVKSRPYAAHATGADTGAPAMGASQQGGAQAGAEPGAQPDAQPAGADLIRFGVAVAPAKSEGAIRLATYNAANLFDAIDDPALAGRNEDIDDAKPESQLRAVAAAILALDADVLAMEEVESEAVLRWFRESYLADAGYEYLAAVDAGDERGIEQVVLSRFPITGVTNWPGRGLGGTHPAEWGDAENYNAGEPIRFHRSPLRVTVEAPGVEGVGAYELTLYVVHAKSGGPGEYWRLAEAEGLVEILASESAPGQKIAILGDFNAMLRDGSVQTIVSAGFADALGDVATGGPEFVTHESGRRIDHILVNPALAAEVVAGSGFVLGTPALPEGADWREDWRPEGYASDHYPVAVDIRVRGGGGGGGGE